jgi:hypothetical protein
MKFFTRDLFERTQSADETILDTAEAEWEAALQSYEEHLQALVPALPAHLRAFQELLLHDALVQSIGRQGNQFLIILRKDIPPRDLVILNYELEGEPVLEPFARHPRDWSRPTAFNFDEFDILHEGGRTLYVQEIVFGNGWLLRLRFRDLRLTRAAPVYPLEHGTAIPDLCPPVVQCA